MRDLATAILLHLSHAMWELVCGTDTDGLGLFDTSAQSWRHFYHPAMLASHDWTGRNVVEDILLEAI